MKNEILKSFPMVPTKCASSHGVLNQKKNQKNKAKPQGKGVSAIFIKLLMFHHRCPMIQYITNPESRIYVGSIRKAHPFN
jgi:hypothetical protein